MAQDETEVAKKQTARSRKGGGAASNPHPAEAESKAETIEPKKLTAKNIVLFSDGTGNSSGKLFKTNVWRMYEAVDLGPSPPDRRDQIAYYDNGIGTSTFKPMAILSGIFGIGLKRNVLHIYRYACRNYRPGEGQRPGQETTVEGDYIYAFGFSRGAFTVRMLIGLIADQGLVPYDGELDLLRKSAAAYRRYRDGYPRYPFSPMRPILWVWRNAGDWWARLRGTERYDSAANYKPVIKFVGVWDTVAAYGGPIAELTRAVDNWVYRLSLPNHQLHERVQKARHALAIDDERDSFQPLLWDEVHEHALVERRIAGSGSLGSWITSDRLDQVWFCGMHADVGGGYPDESLSYVSLLWMIEEADKAGIRTLETITEPYRALANSFGPMHDSRAGLASYYRYQPRKIAAWLDPVDNATLSLRDPEIEVDGKPRGLLTHVKIHESVIARIASGTDRYAPFSLPANFSIHPPGELGEHLAFIDSGGRHQLREAGRPDMVDPEAEARLSDPKRTRWACDNLGSVWDRVWCRRVLYFATLACSLLLLAMPLWVGKFFAAPWLNDGRNWGGEIIDLGRLAAPRFLGGWIRVYEHNLLYTIILVALIWILSSTSAKRELALRDATRAIWHQVLTAKSADELQNDRTVSWIERIRTSAIYQRGLQIVKWHVLPNIVGPAILAMMLWALGGIVTQSILPELEEGSSLCPKPTGKTELTMISRDFTTKALCNPTAVSVRRGQEYEVSLYVVDDWFDGSTAASPAGLRVSDYSNAAGYLGVPYKRVIEAGYLQPVIEIRPPHAFMNKVYIYPLVLTNQLDDPKLYRGSFVAQESGDLDLFANDAVLPITGSWAGKYNIRYFYERSGSPAGNRGTACVLITRKGEGGPVRVVSKECLKAAQQARVAEADKSAPPVVPYLQQ